MVYWGRRPGILVRHVSVRHAILVVVLRWHGRIAICIAIGVHVVGIHVRMDMLRLLVLLVLVMRRIVCPSATAARATTARARNRSHINSWASSPRGLPSRQMTVVHLAGLGFELLQWLLTLPRATTANRSTGDEKPVSV